VAWSLYLVECVDGSLYTGIAIDPHARFALHLAGKGARYTRAHPPARLLATCAFPDRSSALKAEYRLKQLAPLEKRRIAAEWPTTPAPTMQIERDDLSRPAIHQLLQEHLDQMHALSPPESVHALDLGKLKQPGITFWSAWDGGTLLGCGALKELSPTHGEVKSMRTPQALRRRGAGRAMLAHIVAEARSRGYRRLSLETGPHEAFLPAQRLYESFGFMPTGPFGDYQPDPHSVFMTLAL
jgi:putative acetyltransferase